MSLNQLSSAVGISAVDAQAIARAVKENADRLNACGLHDFDPIPGRVLMPRYRCRNCAGEVDSSARYWYQAGLNHARGV